MKRKYRNKRSGIRIELDQIGVRKTDHNWKSFRHLISILGTHRSKHLDIN